MTDWKSHLRAELPPLAADSAREAEIVEELAQHLADLERETVAADATPEAARAAVLSEVSNRQAFAREIRRTDRSQRAPTPPPVEPPGRLLVGLAQEVRHGFRRVARTPVFASSVVVLLALGIGINAATYSVVRNVLLEPLPFRSSEQLTIVWWVDKGTTTAYQGSSPVSGPNFLDWRSESRSFERLVAMTPKSVNLTGLGDAERLQGTVWSRRLSRGTPHRRRIPCERRGRVAFCPSRQRCRSGS